MSDKKSFDKNIKGSGGFTPREIYESLNDEDKTLFLFNHLEHAYDTIFELQQKIDNFEKETDIKLTPDEVLQRKDLWTKKNVCDYFEISSKTFERWKKDGEIKVKKVGGKDYCELLSLKDRFRDRREL